MYHVDFRAEDGRGGECTGTVAVCHPHDQGLGNECVDGGPLFDSTGPCDETDDADADGLLDTEEVVIGTDLLSPDSDQDGFSDWVEVLMRSDPMDAALIPADADGDGVAHADDSCPFVANPDQTASGQFPDVSCACLCGDVNGDCVVNVIDASIAQIAGLPSQPPHPALPDNPPLPPSVTTFDRAFCDINADGACNVIDSPIMQIIGLPTQPVGGPFNNPPLPGGAVVDPTGCCGYLGLDFGCPP